MASFLVLLKNLPQIIRILEAIDRAYREGKIDQKVLDDKEKIQRAFKNKDAKELNRIFNSL